MNLVPAIGELNADRSNFRYGASDPTTGQYGKCNFEVDFENKRAYVRPEIRGDIARIYLYMSEKYSINPSKQERQMMESWDKQDPLDDWESEKVRRIGGGISKVSHPTATNNKGGFYGKKIFKVIWYVHHGMPTLPVNLCVHE